MYHSKSDKHSALNIGYARMDDGLLTDCFDSEIAKLESMEN